MNKFEDWEISEPRKKRKVYILETPDGRLIAREDRPWEKCELPEDVKQFQAVEV